MREGLNRMLSKEIMEEVINNFNLDVKYYVSNEIYLNEYEIDYNLLEYIEEKGEVECDFYYDVDG